MNRKSSLKDGIIWSWRVRTNRSCQSSENLLPGKFKTVAGPQIGVILGSRKLSVFGRRVFSSVLVRMYQRSIATLVCPFTPFLVPKPASHAFRRTLFTPAAASTSPSRRITSRRTTRRKKVSPRYDAQANATQAIVGNIQVWAQRFERGTWSD